MQARKSTGYERAEEDHRKKQDALAARYGTIGCAAVKAATLHKALKKTDDADKRVGNNRPLQERN